MKKPTKVSAILLAAGESKRMGVPKLLMPLGKSTILEQTIDNLLNSAVSDVIIVLGHKAEEVRQKIAAKPVKIVLNPDYQEGMSTSIIAGLSHISSKAEAVMLLLADQPFVDSRTINKLIEQFYASDKGIVVPVYQGKRGHPVIFAIKYKVELLGLKGDVGGREIIERHPEDTLEVAVDSPAINIDIDTPGDYKSHIN